MWTWLAIVSRRRFGTDLPGRFARLHRRLGWMVCSGLRFVALSAAGMYAAILVL